MLDALPRDGVEGPPELQSSTWVRSQLPQLLCGSEDGDSNYRGASPGGGWQIQEPGSPVTSRRAPTCQPSTLRLRETEKGSLVLGCATMAKGNSKSLPLITAPEDESPSRWGRQGNRRQQ